MIHACFINRYICTVKDLIKLLMMKYVDRKKPTG